MNADELTQRIVLADGKYRIDRFKNGQMIAFRHGDCWRDLTGDNLILALLQKIEEHDAQLTQAAQPDKRWPFVESPGEFTDRLQVAMQDCPLIGAVRHVLIENPPELVKAAQPVGVPDNWTDRHSNANANADQPVACAALPPSKRADSPRFPSCRRDDA